MAQDLTINYININPIANGCILRVAYVDKEGDDGWENPSEEFYFASTEEICAFLETNLD